MLSLYLVNRSLKRFLGTGNLNRFKLVWGAAVYSATVSAGTAPTAAFNPVETRPRVTIAGTVTYRVGPLTA